MSGMTGNPEAIGEAIRNARTIAVCSHINPDGDTVGSATAMRLGLEKCIFSAMIKFRTS